MIFFLSPDVSCHCTLKLPTYIKLYSPTNHGVSARHQRVKASPHGPCQLQIIYSGYLFTSCERAFVNAVIDSEIVRFFRYSTELRGDFSIGNSR